MPYYPRSRNTERGFFNVRARSNPYVIPRKSSTPDAQNIPPLMTSLPLITALPMKETKDAATQTITREKNLDPINFARLYISTQIAGEKMEEKRAKFYNDETLNENLRESYRKFVEDHNNTDEKSKLTKVDRKYHLLDRYLNSKILEMSSNQIKAEYPGIGWDYLGLQARMEYQKQYCNGTSETTTDERFFQDKNVLTNLKMGYSRWKTEHISFTNTTLLYIDKSTLCQKQQTQQQNIEQSSRNDTVPVSQILPDITLNTNILSMNLNDIEATYASIDQELLGLQARMEYAKSKNFKDQVSESVHNTDIDFMFDEQIPQKIRSWYRKWLSTNQLIDRQGELLVVKIPNKINNSNTTVPSN